MLSSQAGGVALLLAGPLSFRLGAYFARPSVWGLNVASQTSVSVVLLVVVLTLLDGEVVYEAEP